MERALHPTQRQQRIVEALSRDSHLEVGALARLLSTSSATVRRDLQVLAARGVVTRTHGGASLAGDEGMFEPAYVSRLNQNLLAKLAISRAASELVRDGDFIALDVGTTTLELAKALGRLRNITVFTASLPIALALAQTDVTVVLVGGALRKRELSIVGPIAAQLITQFHFDKYFMGTAGVSAIAGFTDFGLEDIEVKKAFIACSSQIIALADHTKLGRRSLAHICPLGAVNRLITDSSAEPAQIEPLRLAGLQVQITSTETSTN